jgi:hypothetical protein
MEIQGGNTVNFLDTLPGGGIGEEDLAPVPPTTAYTHWGGIDTPFAQHRSGSMSKPQLPNLGGMGQ